MMWFGEAWGAPVCDDMPHTETPVGETCSRCEQAIAGGDQGLLIPHLGLQYARLVPWHLTCFMRAVVGNEDVFERS